MASNKPNRKCLICGKEYSYCPNCGPDKKKPTWYALFHNENCNGIYDACTEYRDGIIDLATAKNRLNALDLSGINDEGFNAGTRKQINNILNTVEVEPENGSEVEEVDEVEETVDKVVENMVEVADKIVETVEEVVAEDKKSEKAEKPKNGFKQSNNYDKHNNKNFRK